MQLNLDYGVIIFSKNEESTLNNLLDLTKHHVDKERIVVVDGHSKDNTHNIVDEHGIRLLLDPGKGKGSAIRFAIDAVDKEILVLMDSDGSHQPKEISHFLEEFINDSEVDLVIGSRFMGGSDELSSGASEIMRRFGNLLSSFIINKRWNTNLTDVQNGFRALKKRSLQDINLMEDSFAIEQEMVMKCIKSGKKVVQIPSWELKRKGGISHITTRNMLHKYIISFVKNIF